MNDIFNAFWEGLAILWSFLWLLAFYHFCEYMGKNQNKSWICFLVILVISTGIAVELSDSKPDQLNMAFLKMFTALGILGGIAFFGLGKYVYNPHGGHE